MFSWPALLSTIPIPRCQSLPKALLKAYMSQQQTHGSTSSVLDEDTASRDSMDTLPKNDVDCEVDKEEEEETIEMEELDENLPEEEAIEKLVEKIMEQYDQGKKKRKYVVYSLKMDSFLQ